MLRGSTIVCLSSIDWAFNWQLPQEVASAFARAGNRVLYVENTGVRRPSLRDLKRLSDRFGNWWRSPGGVHMAIDHLDVLSPLLLPLPYGRPAVAINERLLLRAVRRWIGPTDGNPLIVITFLPTPLARRVIRSLKPDLSVYYCADRFVETSTQAAKLRQSEPLLMAEAGLVLTTSHGLQNTAASIAGRAEYLPCGVRSAEFGHARREATDRPAARDHARHPIVGFTGTLRPEIDIAMLTEVAERAPELSFVFVGPVTADAGRLAALPNVHFLGPVTHAEVVRHTASFDVGMLPYLSTRYTADIMPVKLKEYLAAGLPVVATHLPELCRFADQHPGTIAFADTAETFAAALRRAVAEDATSVERRIEIGRMYDWNEQMAQMSAWMERALAAR